jgi:16S rRNA processing protein RimM
VNDSADGDLVVLGRISGVYGIKGWLKVWSFTDPLEGILAYPAWHLKTATGWEVREIDAGRRQGKGVVVHLPGCDDRDQAQRFLQAAIAVPRAALPELDDGEYYWSELEGLRVRARLADGTTVLLGCVDHLMETGANDVLVVHACEGSLDQRERLIPWIPQQVILAVDRAQRELLVDWDPEF